MARRLTVIECSNTPRKGRARLWAFGYAELAALLGYSEDYLRQLVSKGRLDPRDLRAVCEAWARRRVSGTDAVPADGARRP